METQGGDLMRSWSPEDVRNFLLGKNILPKHAIALMECGVRGEFLYRVEINDLINLKLGIPLPDILLIKKASDKYLEEAEINQNEVRQNPRKFGEPVRPDFKYNIGSILPCENTNYSLEEPNREFKLFSTDKFPDETTEEKAFIERLGKFATACINARYNGTLYFGVADNKSGGHKHGEVRGITTSLSSTCKYEEWIDKHFRKHPQRLLFCSNSEKSAFSSCISSLYVVPLHNSITQFVLEIDITPTFSRTKYKIFKLNNSKFPKGVYYVRKGSSSEPMISKKDLNYFINVEAKMFADIRKGLEESTRPENSQQQLKKILCKGEPKLADGENQYFLLINRFCEEECCKMTDYDDLQWIKLVNWRAIFDFDPKTKEDGMLSLLNKGLIIPHQVKVEELKNSLETNGSNFPRSCEYGKRILHVSCTDDITNDVATWKKKYSPTLTKLFGLLCNESLLEDSSKLIFVMSLCSSSRERQIKHFMKILFMQMPEILQCCSFLAQNNIHLSFMKEAILQEYDESSENMIEEFNDSSIVISWAEISAFVSNVQEVKDQQKYLTTSSGGQVKIKQEIIEMFKKDGLSLLSSNECSDLEFASSGDVTKGFDKTMRQFLQGKETTWDLFYYTEKINDLPLQEAIPSALIERGLVNTLKEKIDYFTNLRGRNIMLMGVGHLPGTGATTVGMHVLWKLKSQYRCALIDGRKIEDIDITKLASDILDIRGFGESEDTCQGKDNTRTCLPLLILVDNSSEDSANNLRRKIQDEVDNRGIQQDKTIGTVFFIHNGHSPMDKPYLLYLKERFSNSERVHFHSKLEQFTKRQDIVQTDMLGFLTFMNKENPAQYEKYVSKVSCDIIDSIEGKYPTELQLLSYLSIFKCYLDAGNISISHANLILGYGPGNPRFGSSFLDFTSDHFNMLVREFNAYEEGHGDYSVLEMTHLPVAEVFLQEFLKKKEKSILSVMSEILEIQSLFDHRFLQSKFIHDLNDLTVKRIWQSSDDRGSVRRKKTLFSPFLQKVMNFSKEDAISLLNKVITRFEKVENLNVARNIGNVYQTLARLYLENNKFIEAKMYARKAINTNEQRFDLYDTLGQIYRNELSVKVEIEQEERSDMTSLLELAKEGVAAFNKAQEIARLFIKKSAVDFVDLETNEESLVERKPGYVGEINIIHSVAKEILKRVSVKHKETVKWYISGKNVDFSPVAEEMKIDLKMHQHFLKSLYDRSQECFTVVMTATDTNKIQESKILEVLRKLCKLQEEIFSQGKFSSLPDYLKKTKPSNYKKIEAVRMCCHINLLNFIYYVNELEGSQQNGMRSVVESTCQLVHLEKIIIDNYLKTCMLNVNLLKPKTPILTYREACRYSFDLSSIESDQYETFFWYVALHWPTPTEIERKKQEETYDEKRIVNCIRKLKKISEENSYNIQIRKKMQRKLLKHNPIYHLTDGIAYHKLTKSRPFRNGDLQLDGRVVDRSYLEFTLPGGTAVEIRAPILRSSSRRFQMVKFSLGFSLEGPLAFYIDNNNESIQMFNDATDE